MNTITAAIPQEDRPEEPKKVLRLAKQAAVSGESIQTLAVNRWYVLEDSNLLELADDLTTYPAIPAVGVTDSAGKLLGQIIRQDLFDLLGRPFGRDVLQKENVVRVAQNSKTFKEHETIVAVCEQIGHDNLAAQQGYFPVKTAQGEFAGIFSTQDLLLRLSTVSRASFSDAGSVQHRLVKDLQILESPEYDILSATFRSPNNYTDFAYIRQYEQAAWSIGMCAPPLDGLTGHLMSSVLWGIVYTFDMRKGVMQLIRHLNALLQKAFESQAGTRGLFMDFQTASGVLTLCDHGNGQGYIYRNGQFLKMKTAAESRPIGQTSGLSTDICRYQLKSGDLVFLMNGTMSDLDYGPTRLKAVLEANRGATIRSLRGLIQADFKDFRGAQPQERDAALVMIHYKQSQAAD